VQELADKVWSNPAFHKAAGLIQRAWIARETHTYISVDYLLPLTEVAKVVRASAILACSTRGEHREKAYRVATSAFELFGDDALPLSQAARVILTRLGNFPAMLTRSAVADARSQMPLRLVTEELAQVESRTILLREKAIVLTDFQHRLWTKLKGQRRLAIAAPTSAGKSFVLQNFLASRLEERAECSIIYIVPTRALIAQVSRDLRGLVMSPKPDDSRTVDIVTVPLESDAALPPRAIYVMTQERLQLMLGGHPDFGGEIIVVDEAHAIGDRSRGVLLQWVVEDLLQRRPATQLLFATPGIRNLGVFARLLGLTDIEPLSSREPAVAQNFLPVAIEDPKQGVVILQLAERGAATSTVAKHNLGLRTTTRIEKLVNVSFAFGHGATNIVYANGAADAEAIALALAQRLADREPSAQRNDLAQLAAEAVHASYALVECVRKGVAFHYSNMPTQVRQSVEKAVADGVIDYLVCTSTLLQGVNLPAKNVFMCQPEKGQYTPLESVDFWNLAGRAGRLLKEFQGNIFLIDYDHWKRKPLSQPQEANVVPAIEAGLLTRHRDLINIIERPRSYKDSDLEAVFVRLLDDYAGGTLTDRLGRLQAGHEIPNNAIASVEAALVSVSAKIRLPREILRRSPNISAHKQQELYDDLFAKAQISLQAARALIPPHPRDESAYESYAEILGLCHRIILRLKPESRFHRFLALIALWWMQGYPLPRIVQNQINRNPGKDRRLVVRDTLELVESEVRYQCVRLFSCYTSILKQVLDDLDLTDIRRNIPSLPLFLEMGASDRTMISLMALGLSRVVAMRLTPLAPLRDLDVVAARNWLRFRPINSLGLSPPLQEEVEALLKSYDERPP